MLPAPQEVARIIARVAAEEIMPRYRNLSPGDVGHKRHPRDLVTTADTIAERRLTEALTALLPGSLVVGEEAADADPDVLRRLAGETPVWLIDPVDGTSNFVHGKDCFAVIVACCQGGETKAGWLHDPISGTTIWAAAGEGAWRQTPAGPQRLRLASADGTAAMMGSLGPRTAERLHRKRLGGLAEAPSRFVRLGSTGREYMELATGALDFAQYHGLKPWDHAAGVLVHREAGGVSLLRERRCPYRAEPSIVAATLLLAPDEAAWYSLDAMLD